MPREDDETAMVDDCMARSEKLSDWEQNFIDSVAKRLRGDSSLTERQQETLEKIWEKVTK